MQKKAEEIVRKTLEKVNEGKSEENKITEGDLNRFIKIMQELAKEEITTDADFGKKVGFKAWSKAGSNGVQSLIEQKLASQNPKIEGEATEMIKKFKIISREMQKQAKGSFDTKEGAKYKSETSGARSYRLCQLLPENFSLRSNQIS